MNLYFQKNRHLFGVARTIHISSVEINTKKCVPFMVGISSALDTINSLQLV